MRPRRRAGIGPCCSRRPCGPRSNGASRSYGRSVAPSRTGCSCPIISRRCAWRRMRWSASRPSHAGLHPTKGLLSPEAFATAFEDRDIAIALGERILRQVVDDLGGWIARGLEPGHAAVNLASAQFAQSDLAERILGILAAARVPPNRLMIEVTETVLLGKSADRVASVLDRLHGAGLRIALDDFGTGYASLTHIKQFPVSEIKIDRSFVRGVERNAGDAAIVAAVAQLGRNLGLDVTAEGVETDGQAQFLRQQNCTFAQGYLFTKPMAASRIPWFLAAHAETGLSRRRLA